MTDEDREELRWYLEEYLRFPYGAEQEHANRVEARMEEWGEALFRIVFPRAETDPDPYTLYHESIRRNPRECELSISSEDTDFLNIPWELLRDPTPGQGYLAPRLKGLYRHRTGHKVGEQLEVPSRDTFRILFVIARPRGDRDIPIGTVCRPMLKALRLFRPRVQVDVLRPPTFDRFQQVLNDDPGYYDLVHFDGHGVFVPGQAGGLPPTGAEADSGHLVFEGIDEASRVVTSGELGELVSGSRVPFYVLNACQSAQEGGERAYGSVASQLVASGALGVVAMSYSVYAETATKFIERFYESLIEHRSLSEAVAAGRRRLMADSGRLSVAGRLELKDWMVPTLFKQVDDVLIPIPDRAEAEAEGEEEPEAKEEALLEQARRSCPEGTFGFIGRDDYIMRIERRLVNDEKPWVLISGIGGIGKTELAYGFARWYAETGGCPGGVFVTGFRDKADFAQVVGSVAGFATDFSVLPEDEQMKMLVSYLYENPCLLIWDNFEPVSGYPEGATPLASDEERDKLRRFLRALKGGRSRVIITSRKTDETWLEIAYSFVPLTGLVMGDAVLLANEVLESVGKSLADYREVPDFSRLLDVLRGHPRSLIVTLPLLRVKSPGEVLRIIQTRIDRYGERLEDVTLTQAFSFSSLGVQRHLPFLGLFTSNVQRTTLGMISSGDLSDVYREVMGEALNQNGWENLLDEAADNGLIASLGEGLYALHPTFPVFLRRRLVEAVGEDGYRRLETEYLTFYSEFSSFVYANIQKGDLNAQSLIGFEEANLRHALDLAEEGSEWNRAQMITQTLYSFYQTRGSFAEWRILCNRLLRWVDEISRDSDTNRAGFWIFLRGTTAIDALRRNDLDSAERTSMEILDYCMSLKDPSAEGMIATGYFHLGRVAEERGDLDGAEAMYRKSLEIFERMGLERKVAADYHHLGMIAEERGDLDGAEAMYRKALEIFERMELERNVADEYHQLGLVAEERGDLDGAETLYRKALEIFERMGLERDAADEYGQLGIINQKRGNLEGAEAMYRKTLEIHERMGLERDAAKGYHLLGMVAEVRGDLDGAEAWYQKALEIFERMGLERDAADEYHQLGMVAEVRGDLDGAEALYRKSLEIFERLGPEKNAKICRNSISRVNEKKD